MQHFKSMPRVPLVSFREGLINYNLIQRSQPSETGIYEMRKRATVAILVKEAWRTGHLWHL